VGIRRVTGRVAARLVVKADTPRAEVAAADREAVGTGRTLAAAPGWEAAAADSRRAAAGPQVAVAGRQVAAADRSAEAVAAGRAEVEVGIRLPASRWDPAPPPEARTAA
jgi:hypothetical protein